MQKKITKNKNFYIICGILIILSSFFILFYKKEHIQKKKINEHNLLEKFLNDYNTDIGENVFNHNETTKIDINNKIDVLKKDDDVFAEDYIAVIEIPKINLKRGLYDVNSINNDVDKNIKILSSSKMPDEEFSNLILASHAGYSNASYFKQLPNLSIDDYIYLFYNKKKYTYIVYNIFEIEKDGDIEINYSNIKNKLLTLITCKLGEKKQIVVMANLISEEEF